MPRIEVRKNLCKGCRLCITTCPVNIINLSKDFNDVGDLYAVQTDMEKCTGCKFCAMICPVRKARISGSETDIM